MHVWTPIKRHATVWSSLSHLVGGSHEEHLHLRALQSTWVIIRRVMNLLATARLCNQSCISSCNEYSPASGEAKFRNLLNLFHPTEAFAFLMQTDYLWTSWNWNSFSSVWRRQDQKHSGFSERERVSVLIYSPNTRWRGSKGSHEGKCI